MTSHHQNMTTTIAKTMNACDRTASPMHANLERLAQIAIRKGWLKEQELGELYDYASSQGVSFVDAALQLGKLRPIEAECLGALAAPLTYAPGYEILDVIGHGGMGVVYYARQCNLNRFVALKTLATTRFTDPAALARFQREAEAIARLRHPNIVGAFDFGRSDLFNYLAMEFVDGIDLDRWVRENGALSELQGWSIARQICLGLKHAQSHGVMHRDLKPSNLIVVDPPEGASTLDGMPMVKIADFGLAIRTDLPAELERVTGTHVALGSPPYMAPEQLDGRRVDHRCDIYCLGAALLHLFTGREPFANLSTAQIIAKKIRRETFDLDRMLPDHSEMSRFLLSTIVEPRRSRRCESYDKILMEIDLILEQDKTKTRPVMLGVRKRSEDLESKTQTGGAEEFDPFEPIDPLQSLPVTSPFQVTKRNELGNLLTRANTTKIATTTALGGGMLILGFVATLGIGQFASLVSDIDIVGAAADPPTTQALAHRPLSTIDSSSTRVPNTSSERTTDGNWQSASVDETPVIADSEVGESGLESLLTGEGATFTLGPSNDHDSAVEVKDSSVATSGPAVGPLHDAAREAAILAPVIPVDDDLPPIHEPVAHDPHFGDPRDRGNRDVEVIGLDQDQFGRPLILNPQGEPIRPPLAGWGPLGVPPVVDQGRPPSGASHRSPPPRGRQGGRRR